jgi:multidrug efflux system outer membrane protein
LAKANRDIALATYQKTIQSAFRDVADTLARAGTIDDQLAANRLNLTAADDTFTLSQARYRQGIDPYLLTLDAQRTLYTARRTLSTTRLIKAQNLVATYQALGGDQLLADLPGTTAAKNALIASPAR